VLSGRSTLNLIICMTPAMSLWLLQAMQFSIDTSFKHVHGWQEFEIESWDHQHMQCTCGISLSPSNKQQYSLPIAQYVPSLPSFNSPPETPLPLYSTSSPASSGSPPTPIGIKGHQVLEAIRAHSRAINQKQDVCLCLPGGVVILYIYTSHLSVASRAGFLLDKRSPISYIALSPSWPVAHLPTI